MSRQAAPQIKKIFDSYARELLLVEESLKELFASNVFLIPLIGRYLSEGGGKRLRPMFLLASARLSGYRGDGHIPLAGVIESIHTASLLHDDVVDGAEIRRGRPPAHALWGNQVVILVGDYLYSNSLKRAASYKDVRIIEALSTAVTAMTEGELLQLEKSGDINITEEDYFRIVTSKTGVLISSACRIGGMLGGVEAEQEEALARFGLKAGITFQMADDLLDYKAATEGFGKKLGKDLEEGKITLPLIYLIRHCDPAQREEIKGMIERGPSEDDLARILLLFRKYRAIEKAVERAEILLAEAKAELEPFGGHPVKDELFALADYAIAREH